MYYKNFLQFKLIYITYLHESILIEIQIVSVICQFIFLYRSPNQTDDIFEKFLEKMQWLTVILS